jgi:hypothetical protein
MQARKHICVEKKSNGRFAVLRLIPRWMPLPSVCHPYPLRRMGVIT